MPVKKRPDQEPAQPAATGRSGERRVWKKKTPVEVFFDQEVKLRREIERDEQELTLKRDQLRKFEEARRIFESS